MSGFSPGWMGEPDPWGVGWMGETQPPDAPTGNIFFITGLSTAEQSWAAPVNDGGASLEGYKIERKAGAGEFEVIEANTGSLVTVYQHTGLTAGVVYTVRVSAINSEGVGPASNEAFAQYTYMAFTTMNSRSSVR